MEEPLKGTELRGVNPQVLEPPLFTLLRSRGANICVFEPPFLYCNMSSLSSNSSPSRPGLFHSQRFHHVFPATLPCRQHNILYASVLQQPPLSPNWKDSRHMKMMSLFKVLFAFFTTCVQLRFT